MLVELNCILFFRYATVNVVTADLHIVPLPGIVSFVLGYRSTEQSSFLSSSFSHWRYGQTLDCMVDLVGIYHVLFKKKKWSYMWLPFRC